MTNLTESYHIATTVKQQVAILSSAVLVATSLHQASVDPIKHLQGGSTKMFSGRIRARVAVQLPKRIKYNPHVGVKMSGYLFWHKFGDACHSELQLWIFLRSPLCAIHEC